MNLVYSFLSEAFFYYTIIRYLPAYVDKTKRSVCNTYRSILGI